MRPHLTDVDITTIMQRVCRRPISNVHTVSVAFKYHLTAMIPSAFLTNGRKWLLSEPEVRSRLIFRHTFGVLEHGEERALERLGIPENTAGVNATSRNDQLFSSDSIKELPKANLMQRIHDVPLCSRKHRQHSSTVVGKEKCSSSQSNHLLGDTTMSALVHALARRHILSE